MELLKRLEIVEHDVRLEIEEKSSEQGRNTYQKQFNCLTYRHTHGGVDPHSLISTAVCAHALTEERVCWDRRDNTYATPMEAEGYVSPEVFTTADREECQDACEANVNCTFYNFVNVRHYHHCYEYEHVGIKSYSSINQSNVVIHTGSKIHVPWRRESNTNAIWGLIPPGSSKNPPDYVFYFEEAQSQLDCEQACESEPDCDAYAWHSADFGDDDWKNSCHGVPEALAAHEPEAFVHSGYPCDLH